MYHLLFYLFTASTHLLLLFAETTQRNLNAKHTTFCTRFNTIAAASSRFDQAVLKGFAVAHYSIAIFSIMNILSSAGLIDTTGKKKQCTALTRKAGLLS